MIYINYLKCGYKDLRSIHNKMNMTKEKQIRISSTFFLMCKQDTKYNIADIMLWEKTLNA